MYSQELSSLVFEEGWASDGIMNVKLYLLENT